MGDAFLHADNYPLSGEKRKLFARSSRLILARQLNDSGLGTPYAYGSQGELLTDTISANLGAAVNWSVPGNGEWNGTLGAEPTTLAFTVRDSEISSTIHTPGAQGALILVLETSLPPDATLEVTGAQIIGTASINGKTTYLLRVTEAGVKLVRLAGTGDAQVRIAVAGDLNRDGNIDGTDSQMFEQALASPLPNPLPPAGEGANVSYGSGLASDLNGDGLANSADRQVLYANTGFKANQAPAPITQDPTLKTHTDLATRTGLKTIAEDLEGDTIFWRILGATHGTAQLGADGQTLSFTPEAGFVGEATLTLQADDGFATSTPINLKVNVSGAKLLAIHLAELPNLAVGQFAQIKATADFEDEQGVTVTSPTWLSVSTADLSGMGSVSSNALAVDDSRDLVRAITTGPALVIVTRLDTDGRTVRAVAAINTQAAVLPVAPNADPEADTGYSEDPLVIQPDVYPGTLTLIPGGTRQLKIHLIDPNTGEQVDIHTASQTVFAGSPESVESYLDPSTQDPLLDPVTGEVLLDPDTGEVLLDPNTGTTIQYVIPAAPPVYSGTRYFVSEETIATVSADGLITALKAGEVTVSIVHLASGLDAYGFVTQQAVGQTDIHLTVQVAQLTDNDPFTDTPAGITVSAAHGGVVQAATGETVMIGAGALATDIPVSISRINVDDLDALGMPAPAPGGLQAVGAFKLDIGEKTSNYPLQLAIPVQDGISAQAGDEVWFFRKGTVLTEDGTYKGTWWLVDNGFVGTDGVARTASPPYTGLDDSGEYLVAKRLPGVIGGEFDLVLGAGDSLTFDGLTGMAVSIGGGLMGANITSEMIGIIATMSGTGTAASYHFGVPQFATVTFPPANPDEIVTIDLGQILPPVKTPYGNVVYPEITAASVDETNGNLKFTVANEATEFFGSIAVRALFPDGSHQDVLTLPGSTKGEIEVPSAKLVTADGKPFAIGSVRWQLVRLISTELFTGSGKLSGGDPLEFAGNTARISAKSDMVAVLTRTGIDLYRQDKRVGHTALLLDNDQSLTLPYLTGGKVQPVAFSGDLSTIFVAGKGVVYVIDSLTFKLIHTITLQTGKNISSLATSGYLLLIGEGQRIGSGVGSRLLAMNTRPGSADYGQEISLKNTGIESSPLGISGMTIGPDGKTLVVGVPINPNTVSLGDKTKRGNVLVFDLSTLDLKTGKIATPTTATLPGDGISGKSPQIITATQDPDRYLVADIADYNRGLSTLVITRDDKGEIIGAKMSAIAISQPTDAIRIDRLDIQRAQSAVLAEYKGIEYAIVSDDNYHFLDPYWKAMYEAPDFLYTPSGPPIAVGGSASAKKVNVGGKLGIVKDPFGTPTYLGATLPLDGYGIVNLSLSEDGKVLMGQLKGGYSGNILSSEANTQKPSQSHVWNVDALIAAALAMPDQDRMSKHIKLLDANAEQLVEDGTAPVAGTSFDPEEIRFTVEGRMGDVVEVDLKWHVADDLARKTLGLFTAEEEPESSMSLAEKQALAVARENILNFDLKEFELNFYDVWIYGDDQDNPEGDRQFKLITEKGASGDPYSRDGEDRLLDAKFKNTGRMFLAPVITDADEKKLRAGEHLSTPKRANLWFTVEARNEQGEWEMKHGQVNVMAKDYPKLGTEVFFGDRDLKNPGYSAFKLKEDVKVGSKDPLDVYRVEQRLKYLGYPAMGQDRDNAKRLPEEFKVDGKWEDRDAKAAYFFNKVIHYGSPDTQLVNVLHGKKKFNATSYANALNSQSRALTIDRDDAANTTQIIDYLNAYNAPHWMDIGPQMQYQSGVRKGGYSMTGWDNQQIEKNPDRESYGTSWMRDLMVAKQYAPAALVQSASWFNGTTDANHGYTPRGHGSHDLGMAFDLGVSNYIAKKGAQTEFTEALKLDSASLKKTRFDPADPAKGSLYDHIPDKAAYEANRWSLDNALYLTGLLPDTQSPARDKNDQVSALKDFLSLYAVTQKDGGGVWGALPVRNGEAARAALFGTGDKLGGLISSVLIGGKKSDGQNPYPNINDILGHLNIPSTPYLDHQNHFHINLRPPKVPDVSKPLLAQDAATDTPAPVTPPLPEVQSMADYVQSILEPGEELMFTLDVPAVPAQETPIVLAQAFASAAGSVSKQPDFILKECQEVPSTGDPRSAMRAVDPAYMLKNFLEFRDRKDKRVIDLAAIKTTLIEAPKHGKITTEIGNDGLTFYGYDPIPNYEGRDRAVFMAEFEGKCYKIVIDFRVVEFVNEKSPVCPKPQLIKVNKPISGFDLSGLSVSFAPLDSNSVGQTTGTTITLDSNAAGYNWFIDSTPADNAEFLPTSNPNEWIAKAGSEAEGKMDLLSVLLHEYGHALGIGHSADSGDYMAATLQPGVRRLPSSDELALMAQLVGEIKTAQDNIPNTPINPSVPIGAGLSALLIGRLRRTDYGSWSPMFDSVQIPVPAPQFEIAANPKLQNPDFDGGTDWATEGTVAFSNGAATLTETAATQTRLNQVFVLGEHDRFLSFTLKSDLQTNGSAPLPNPLPQGGEGANGAAGGSGFGPSDAFEVALLDANTGHSLMGTTGLTHNDAILNLQANGTEHKATGITRIDNPDGSHTYLVDLAGIPAGTTINLAFDLIGFGQGAEASNSQITVRDLRLGVPQTADDSATLAEDTPAVIDALANDLNARQPGFAPVVVSGPAHGQVEANADGSFSFTPEQDWYGQDTFTYKLSDGRVDSNLATVTLTVTPVNDAPVAADAAVNLAEDTPYMIDLLALAGDIDSSTLAATIVSGPAHGSLGQNADGSFTYTPDADYNGSDSFAYKVSDGELDSNLATVTLNIAPVNDAPAIAPRTITLDEDIQVILDLLQGASDADGDSLSVAITAAPLHGSLARNEDGTWTYAPEANWNGTDTVEYQVSDGTVATSTRLAFVVNPVNDAPVIAPRTITLDEDIQVILDLLQGASDVDGDSLSVDISAAPLHGSLARNEDGTWTYAPEANWNGTDTVEYEVSDGTVATSTRLSFVVNPVNDAPVLAGQALETAEDAAATGHLLASAADIDSAVLAATVIAGPQHGQVSVAADGSFTYTPDANYNGADSFTYKVNDGELDSNIATVSLSINAVNDAPTLTDSHATLAEDGTITLDPVGWVDAGYPTAVAQDIDGDFLTARLIAGPTHGTPTANPDGSYTYTPEANYNGSDIYTYVVNDGTAESNVATVTLTVTPVNDAPIAQDGTATLNEDGNLNLDLRTLGLDIDNASLAALIVAGPAHGSLIQNADNTWTYTPEANYNGTDAIRFKLNDGELDSNEATITLTVIPVNDAPTAGDQPLSTDEDTLLTGSLLAAAADIDSTRLTAAIVAGPQHGQVKVAADGSFTYLADANYNGPDSFTYKVNDGELDSTIATVTLAIAAVNDVPVASPIVAALAEDGSLILNFLDSASDVDGDPLSITVGNPLHGQLIRNDDGSYTYRPEADHNGEDSLGYTVSDGQLNSAPARVRLTITAVNDAPVAQDDIATLVEDNSIRLAIMANDHDVDNDTLSLVIVTQPAHGTLLVNEDHTVSYTPAANWSGEDSFTYKVNDGELDSSIATVRLIVNAQADAPTLVLTDMSGASRELFRTGWESVANKSPEVAEVKAHELEGWTLVATGDTCRREDDDHDRDGDNEAGRFMIWSDGDRMKPPHGRPQTVQAAVSGGANWLELADAQGEGHQTLGIERAIDTIAGARYTFSFDVAAHLGYGAEYTRFGIYADGARIGGWEGASPADSLNWQKARFEFNGRGGAQTLRIVSEATQRESNGRGALLDNLTLTETLPANTGWEDGAVPCPP